MAPMIRFLAFLILFTLVMTHGSLAQVTVSGYVYDSIDKEALLGATILDEGSGRGTVTNHYGFFSLTIPIIPADVRISYIGFETKRIRILSDSTSILEILLVEQSTQLGDVTVTDDRIHQEAIQSVRMGSVSIKPVDVNRIPSFAGEADLLKVMQLMPGVTQGNEATGGMFVRGGTDDQNLVLLDDAVIYNVGHLFGFFSVFNTDAINDIQLVKGAFPARYGGRLSSVLDIRMNEGSLERWNVRGGVGLLTSRIMIDGPLIKDRMSFMVAGRRTYIDQVLKSVKVDLPYYFYDVNAKLNYRISESDRVYLSSYFGDDILDFQDRSEDAEDLGFGFTLGNWITTARWNHVYASGKTFSNVTLHQTRFNYDIRGDFVDNSILITSKIQDVGIKLDWETFPRHGLRYQYGGSVVTHGFRPNVVNTSGNISELVGTSESPIIRSTEAEFHGSIDWDMNDRWRMENGIRYSMAWSGRHYGGFEPRSSIRYLIDDDHSIKFGYSRMRQYMHRVSSSAIALPTDLWYPVTENVKPQSAHQVSIGYFGSEKQMDITYSVELFSKRMENLIEYKEGARLILNDRFESELLRGNGLSRGLELFIRKHSGWANGWIGYTLSKTDRQFAGLNGGESYPDRFDRRHNISAVAMIDISENMLWSVSWVYMSGARMTAQTGQFLMPNASLTGVELVPIYSKRNAVELASSHRLDINFIIKGRLREYGQGEWHLSAYNFYNRAAPYRVSFRSNGSSLEYVQQGLFGVFPSIAYNFRFHSK
jgi:hypothetical protein